MKRFGSLTWFTALLFSLLAGCGGGGGTGVGIDSLVAEGGMGGSGITMGRASSFDPLTINGQAFDTTNSQFVYEEEVAIQPGDDSGLRVGMVVRVTSVYGNDLNLASQVEYAKVLEGAITLNEITPAGIGTLEALGQVITVNQDTIYNDGDLTLDIPLNTLPLGAMIELSGFTDGKGTILATRIDLKSLTSDADTLQEIKGIISNLDLDGSSFNIGGLSIDYTGLSLPQGFENGIYGEVKGFLIGGLLEASSLEIEGDGSLAVAADGERVLLEGIVTDVIQADVDGTLFVLNGQQVLATDLTGYDPGKSAADILINQPMQVEGIMQGAILVAGQIDIKVSSADKSVITATLEAIDKDAGLLTLLGQTVSLASSTVFEDEVNPRFNLARVNEGDYLELSVSLDETSQLVASKMKKRHGTNNGKVEIEGTAQQINLSDETLLVFNVKVHYPGLAALLADPGDHVELTGSYDQGTGTVEAETISISDNLQGTPPGL